MLPVTEREKEAVALREGEAYLQNVEYNNPAVVFPRAMILLQTPTYINSFLRGLVVSIGTLPFTDSRQKCISF